MTDSYLAGDDEMDPNGVQGSGLIRTPVTNLVIVPITYVPETLSLSLSKAKGRFSSELPVSSPFRAWKDAI